MATLNPQCVSEDSFLIAEGKESQAEDTLQLLRDITSDLWWNRAWTFQENYRSSDWMMLLMRHTPSLERRKNMSAKSKSVCSVEVVTDE